MIPDDYLRLDMWDIFDKEFPQIENIEQYACNHYWVTDCATGEEIPWYCIYCWKKKIERSSFYEEKTR
jgi:hypothetical protein